MGFWEGDVIMDLDTLPSVASHDPIEDLDITFREEDAFDAIGCLLPLTVVYGEYSGIPTIKCIVKCPTPPNCPFVRC
jgi:hypothetical protein